VFLCGCNGKEEHPDITLPENPIFERIYKDYNIRLSSDSITYIGDIIENETNIIILGRKYNNAWIGVYNLLGSELFSHTVEESHPDKEYSHFNAYSMVYADDDMLFFRGWYSNMWDLNSMGDIDLYMYSFLSIVDMKKGKEIKRLAPIYGPGLYAVKSAFDAYLISEGHGSDRDLIAIPSLGVSSGYKNFYMMKNGNILWERQCIDYENYDGIDYYNNHKFIDYENILYYDERRYKSINLKDCRLNYEIDIPISDDYNYIEDLAYKLHDASVTDDYIYIKYGIYKVLGNSDHLLLNEYYYKIDKQTGSIIENRGVDGYNPLYGISIEGLYMDNPMEQQYPFDYDDLKLCHGDRLKIKIKFIPQIADNKNLKWSSSDTNLATVEDGLFSITSDTKAKGTVFITATSEEEGYTAGLSVNVDDVHLAAHGLRLIQYEDSQNLSFISAIMTSPVNFTPITIGSVCIIDENNALIQIVSDVQDHGYGIIARSQPVTIYGLSGDNLFNYLSMWKFVYTYKLPWMNDFATKEVAINARLWSGVIF
jgi:hypothetical protein